METIKSEEKEVFSYMKEIKFCDMFKFLHEHPNYNLYVTSPVTSFTLFPENELPLKDKFQRFYLFESDKKRVTYQDLNMLKKTNSQYVLYQVVD